MNNGTVNGLLGVVFVTLKLCGVISWSWWWVLLPFWWPLAILLLFTVLFAAVCLAVPLGEFLLVLVHEKRARARYVRSTSLKY